MSNNVLHLIVDALCGWSYAANPMFKVAQRLPNLRIQLHSGGMLAFERKSEITPQWKAYVTPLDQRIAAISGMPFGEGYQQLLEDVGTVLDSEPPAKAIMAVNKLGLDGVTMLLSLQQAYYQHGRMLSDFTVLKQLAEQQGLETEPFTDIYQSITEMEMREHFKQSTQLLNQLGGRGYPTAALQTAEGIQPIDLNQYCGRPEQWLAKMTALLARSV